MTILFLEVREYLVLERRRRMAGGTKARLVGHSTWARAACFDQWLFFRMGREGRRTPIPNKYGKHLKSCFLSSLMRCTPQTSTAHLQFLKISLTWRPNTEMWANYIRIRDQKFYIRVLHWVWPTMVTPGKSHYLRKEAAWEEEPFQESSRWISFKHDFWRELLKPGSGDARPLGLAARARQRAHCRRKAVRCWDAHCPLQPQGFRAETYFAKFLSLQYGSPKEAAKEPDGLAVLGIFIMVNFYGHLLEHVTTISYSWWYDTHWLICVWPYILKRVWFFWVHAQIYHLILNTMRKAKSTLSLKRWWMPLKRSRKRAK